MSDSSPLRAVIKGLFFLMILNAFYFVALVARSVALNWNSVFPEPILQQVTIQLPGKVIEQVIEQESLPNDRLQQTEETVLRLKVQTTLLSAAIVAGDTQQNSTISEMTHQLALLQHNVKMLGNMRPPAKQEMEYENSNLLALQTLLHEPSIAGIPSVTLNEMLQKALQALDAMKSIQTVDWAQVDAILNVEYKRDNNFTRELRECPSAATIELDQNVARQSHRKGKLVSMTSRLDERRSPNALINTLMTSQTILQIIKEGMIQSIQEESQSRTLVEEEKDDTIVNGICVDNDNVNHMVQGALTDSSNMNHFLTHIVQELDPNEKNLIFDAMLGVPGGIIISPKQNRNLRQLLDNGVTKWTAKQLDGVLDLLSGYNDFVDATFDQLMEQHPDSTMGQILVGQILELAGGVTVPNLFHTKAGILMH
jgi:hypothetical protein